jgi:hypothetical protein
MYGMKHEYGCGKRDIFFGSGEFEKTQTAGANLAGFKVRGLAPGNSLGHTT